MKRECRKYMIGSAWLYYKIYSGPKILEYIYLKEIYPIITKLIENNAINKFFFIRYQDPNYHLRLRLKLSESSRLGEVVNELYNVLSCLLNDNILSGITIDTYKPEFERYGTDLIEYAESIFYEDSVRVSNFLVTNPNTEIMLLESVLTIDAIYNIMGFDITEKIGHSKMMFKSYFEEMYKSNPYILKLINTKYRNYKSIVINVLKQPNPNIGEQLGSNYFSEYFKAIKSYPDFGVTQMSSIIHMHINRLYRTNQRLIECIIYSFLLKSYKSICKLVDK